MIRTTLFVALLSLPATGLAAPAVLFHVPDGATSSVDGADMALHAERSAVADSETAVIQLEEERADLKARRRDARHDRREERRELRHAVRDLRKAERKGDDAGVANARVRLEANARELADATDHLAWHRAQIDRVKAELGVARTERSLQRAELELAQAELLEARDAGMAPLLPTSVFEGQARRIDTRVEIRTAKASIEDTHADDARSDFVCRLP